MKKKKGFAMAMAGFVAAVLAMGVLMHIEWRSYHKKMEILYVALEQGEEGKALFDTAAGLLKGKFAEDAGDTEDAKQKLEQYGYRLPFLDQYKKELYRDWGRTQLVFAFLYLGFLASLYLGRRMAMGCRRDELLWLEGKITKMRDFGGQAKAEGYGGWMVQMEKYDEDMGRLLMELDALRDSLLLMRRQAKVEKEGTKALVTDISHQLKTPVAAFKASFEILQSEGLHGAQRQEFLHRCGVQLQRLEELVGALVNISRMETGMIEIQRKRANLFDTILLAVSRIYPKAEEKGIEVELEADEPLRRMAISHDAKWLCEAFLNILENAVKYSGRGTKITIRMIRMSLFLRIEVEDEGIGIPKGEWNRIFKRFYRGEAKEVQETPGSGVGLYLAREIVVRQGGTLVVASPHGKRGGSCFVFQLPYLQEGDACPMSVSLT